MSHKKILVPTDFSPSSEAAMKAATSLARDNQAKLLIVHVEEPPLAYGAGEFYVGSTVDDTQELAEQLARVVPGDPAIEYEHRLLSGDPAHEIVALADEEKCDLIVMGTHGRTGLMRLLMGSVAESIVRHATCPVFTLRQPTHAAAEH